MEEHLVYRVGSSTDKDEIARVKRVEVEKLI
jgi:hypothetical protein